MPIKSTTTTEVGKKENSAELQKPNVEAEICDNSKKMWLRKRKKKQLKSLFGFLSANKFENYNRGREKEKKKKEKNLKESTETNEKKKE